MVPTATALGRLVRTESEAWAADVMREIIPDFARNADSLTLLWPAPSGESDHA